MPDRPVVPILTLVLAIQHASGNVTVYWRHIWLKNRRPDRWRDVQNIDAKLGPAAPGG